MGKKIPLQLFQVHHLSPGEPGAACTNKAQYEKKSPALKSVALQQCFLHISESQLIKAFESCEQG